MRMGVVADDVTGSNDIGIMFAKGGCLAHVYTFEGPQAEDEAHLLPQKLAEPDICILDTNSRLDESQVAYEKVFAATRLLQKAGCRQFFNKTCSVFRGNIGAEFDAMLDALGREFAVVVLGFPKNGRVTREGIHYVHGKRLEESEFRSDPIHPMRRSDLVGILGSQTHRKVSLLDYRQIEKGPQALRQAIDALRSQTNYLILDVLDQDSLRIIAQAVKDEPVLCGSSAIGEELPAVWGVPQGEDRALDLPQPAGTGILCLAGSLMPQTAAQIRYLQGRGVLDLQLDTLSLFEEQTRQKEVERLAERACSEMQRGKDVLLHTPYTPEMVARTEAEGAGIGRSKTETSRLVSSTIAEIGARVLRRTGQNRLVVAGGETSAAVCERLDVDGMMIWKEIQPGLPSCLSLTEPPLLLVLKSGSFGSPEFLEQAIQHLRSQ